MAGPARVLRSLLQVRPAVPGPRLSGFIVDGTLPRMTRLPTQSSPKAFLSTAVRRLQDKGAVPHRSITRVSALRPDSYDRDVEAINVASSRIEDVCLLEDERMLEVKWEDGEVTRYPYVWLRDNCQCETCFHQFTKARLLLMSNLDINVRPEHFEVDAAKKHVVITWKDGHQSPLDFGWLRARSFTSAQHARRDLMFRQKPVLWGHDFQDRMPTFQFEQLLDDDRSLYELLTTLEEYGVAVVRGAPTEEGQVKKVASRISFMRMTPFGFIYSVKVREDPPNLAWTSDPLGLHVDFPYLRYTPGVQLLHCIVQANSKGGATELVDAFQAAHQMKTEYPFYYKLLSEVPVDFTDYGSDLYPYYYLARHTTFRHNFEGELQAVSYSNQTRDSFLRVPLELVIPFYKGLRLLNDFLYRAENRVAFKLTPGDIVCFDNDRVLHGRTGFTMIPGSPPRHLEGCYIDWDDIHSKRRLLKENLGIEV